MDIRTHFTRPKFTIGVNHVPVKELTYTQGNLKYTLQRFCRTYSKLDFAQFLVANHIAGDPYGGMFQHQQGKEIHMAWKKHHEGLAYYFEEEITKLADMVSPNKIGGIKIESLWDCGEGHPIILKALFCQTAPLETLAILNKLFRFQDVLDVRLSDDPAWKDTSRLLSKYAPFLDPDVEKFRSIVLKTFEV